MPRIPDECPHRNPSSLDHRDGGGDELAVCGVLSTATGISDPIACSVRRDACEACCESLRDPHLINPVIASLIYAMASRIAAAGGHPECSEGRAAGLIRCATDQLAVVIDALPGEQFPPPLPAAAAQAGAPSASPSASPATMAARPMRWATALLTAPRKRPKIGEALESLQRAGFEDLHIFAEPEAWIPRRFRAQRVTRRTTKLGNFANFYSCLSTLLGEHPHAEAFAVFQDDIRVAQGLKRWCEEELWPLDNGIVSLFTPRLHAAREIGWRILSPGFQRVCGAQAMVFHRDMLRRFLSDPHVLQCLRFRRHCDDAVLGGWLSREGLGIAYHTPSPIEHIGTRSSIYHQGPDRRNVAGAVRCMSGVEEWKIPAPRRGEIGLVGWNAPTGLGAINRDLAAHLDIARWLAPPHPEFAPVPHRGRKGLRIDASVPNTTALLKWVRGLDWLLFAERPYIPELPRLAAHKGAGIACVPMWEWVQPHHAWLQFVDVMICPTRHAYHQMRDWTERYGYGWKTVYIPWPVDTGLFRFRQRTVCREFLFVNGWGGGSSHRPDGSPLPQRRKGLELVLAAARLAPDLNFVVRSLSALPANLPGNVRVVAAPADPGRLYDQGDVCVQPSFYEGLGLQLLECQAAGLPLVTTDAPPMNEAHPWRRIPTRGQEVVRVGDGYICAQRLAPEDLVATLRPLVGTDLRQASQEARAAIEAEHNWHTAGELIAAELLRR